MTNLAIFASGSGSNAQNIAEYFKDHNAVNVKLILTNNPDAYVLERVKNLNIPAVVFSRDDFYRSENVLDILKKYNIDFIVLAGFLWLIPDNLIKQYPDKIINIHPALLPKYGGKGMYGAKVHEAVHAAGETETGITIHYVNEKYDEGKIIFQAKAKITQSDTPDNLASLVHALEYEHFPRVIESILT